MKFLYIYLIVINIGAFIAMCVDKWRAHNYRWRVPERILFLLAIFGGSFGAIAGMWLIHHKTRRRGFTLGIPAILVLHILIWILFFK